MQFVHAGTDTGKVEVFINGAETLDEFRGRYKYNMMDEHVRAMNAMVPVYYQWDDHEVTNNGSASKDLTADDRYSEKSIALLSARGRVLSKAVLEERLYAFEDEIAGNAVEVYVSRLRAKLGADLIETRRGLGYLIP